jgi:uncharacterized membrane protein
MASAGSGRTGIAPEPLDRALGFAAIAMLAIVLAAIGRGHGHWGEPPAVVWGHLALVIAALGLTPVMMLRAKGSDSHRLLGTIWVVLLVAIAVEGFFIPLHGRSFSPIWLISLFVLWRVPTAFLAARRHQIARHRAAMRGTVIGAFVVAGLFTLPFGRMLGTWLFHG